jgi:hypothetical protein
MSEYQGLYDEASAVTLIAGSGGVVGGAGVLADGTMAGDAAVGAAGVAKIDAASGQPFGIYREGIHRTTASGAIAVKDPLCFAATATVGGVTVGRVRKWVAGTDAVAARIGTAWSAAADGQSVTYALFGV